MMLMAIRGSSVLGTKNAFARTAAFGQRWYSSEQIFDVKDEIKLRDELSDSEMKGTIILDCYADWCRPCKVWHSLFISVSLLSAHVLFSRF